MEVLKTGVHVKENIQEKQVNKMEYMTNEYVRFFNCSGS